MRTKIIIGVIGACFALAVILGTQKLTEPSPVTSEDIRKLRDDLHAPESFVEKAIEQDEESKRSPHWPTVEKHCVAAHPFCAYCGISQQEARDGHNNLAGHHKHVFHLMSPEQRGSNIPGGELDPNNVIILCLHHHFEIGHLRNWKNENQNVQEQCEKHEAEMRKAGTWPQR